MSTPPESGAGLGELLTEYNRAIAHTDELWLDLTVEQIHWRPNAQSSAIGWHLGHQPAVAHFMVRNLTAAEPSPDPALDVLMDSATPEVDRGELPGIERLRSYRNTVADRVRFRVTNIDAGNVGAPNQLRSIATTMLTAIINHEYQHSLWISEVRRDQFGLAVPPWPTSHRLIVSDGYTMVR